MIIWAASVICVALSLAIVAQALSRRPRLQPQRVLVRKQRTR